MTHYFDKEQQSELSEEEITVRLFGKLFKFYSASGLFSREHLDNATKLLVENCELTSGQKVLDLGCGWGAVCLLIGERCSYLKLFACDSNTRAVAYTKKNARKHNISVIVKQSNILDNQDKDFDVILTNPPYVAGRETCFDFINQSFEHLKQGGSLQLVARHNKGGKMLEKHMQDIFDNVTVLAKSGGFRVYKSVKN
ncbi:methyltransferase [Candidatus Woesearchaeota archaeon]|nr:methyltransferase [Candidatus Woesearchaeota archaeon]